MLWTRDEIAAVATKRERDLEFEDRRRLRMQERESRSRLYRVQSGNVLAFPKRPPLSTPPDGEAA